MDPSWRGNCAEDTTVTELTGVSSAEMPPPSTAHSVDLDCIEHCLHSHDEGMAAVNGKPSYR